MNNRERFQEKRDFVILWLLEFRYSTKKILAQALGQNVSGMTRFFQRLEQLGVIAKTKSPFVYGHLVYLGRAGKDYAGLLSEKAESYPVTKGSVPGALNVHGLSVQLAVLRRSSLMMPFDFKSEWHLELETGSRPDALVTTGTTQTALEIELAQKTQPRIFLAFLTHVQNMRGGHYDRVEYIFSNRALCASYEKLFLEPSWPMYTRSKKGYITRVMESGEAISAKADDPLIRERFTFTHEELYL